MQTTVSSFLHQRFLAVALVYQLQYQHIYLGQAAGKERSIKLCDRISINHSLCNDQIIKCDKSIIENNI